MRIAKKKTRLRYDVFGLLLASAILTKPAHALDPAMRLQDYNHTTWTERDGAPRHIENIVQTADGWIWISTIHGLFRFDGNRFEPVTLAAQREPWRERIGKLYAAPNGDLWISFRLRFDMLIVHPDGRQEVVTTFDKGFLDTLMLTTAPDGSTWSATTRGLRRFRDKREVDTGALPGLPDGVTYSVLFDPDGRMWVAHERGVFMRPAGAARFERVADAGQDASLVRSPDGALWLVNPADDRVRLLAPRPGGHQPTALPEAQRFALYDSNGNLWSTMCRRRLCRTAGAGALPSLRPAALAASGKAAVLPGLPPPALVMEDSEHSVWVATDSTLERFRDSRLLPAPVPIARGGSMGIDDAGQVWVVDRATQTAWRMSATGAVADRSQPFQMVSDDIDQRLLLAGRYEIERRWRGQVEKIPLPPSPDARHPVLNVIGIQDDGKILWMYSTQTSLVGYVGGRWRPRKDFPLPNQIMLGTPAGGGRWWLACLDGTLVLYDNGKTTRYDARVIGGATVMHLSEHLVVAGNLGIAVLKGDRLFALTAPDPTLLNDVSGIAVDAAGDRWLNGARGVVHVRAADWRASVANPALPLRVELFDAADGYAGRAYLDNGLPSAMVGKDGQLWVGTTEGVLHMDTRVQRRPAAPPRIAITGFSSDGVNRSVHDGAVFRIAPEPRNISIGYTAPGMGRPEAVRFAYRLVNEDSDWQEVGARRTAFFTALGPGRHRFEVRAANQDGVWSTAPAFLELDVAPTLTQTTWFRIVLGMLALTAVWLLQRWRLRTLAQQIRARMNERIDERNRIARELHDTLLQSVQSLQLKVQGASMRLAPDEPVKPMLEAALRQAESAIDEGRARVRDLRGDEAGEADELTLADMLTAVARELGQRSHGAGSGAGDPAAPLFALQVSGKPRMLCASVRAEVFAIGREALVNAYRHARAAHTQLRLDFGKREFTLTISDDGAGVPDEALGEGGRPGHWGIRGMRERAAAIGAQLRIGRAAGARGTVVAAVVPAALAYARSAPYAAGRWWQ